VLFLHLGKYHAMETKPSDAVAREVVPLESLIVIHWKRSVSVCQFDSDEAKRDML